MSPYTTIPTSIILTTIYDTTMKSTTEIETLQPSTQKPATTTKKCISNPDSCPPGFICGKGECFPGCTSNHPCPLGMECIKPVPNAIVGYAFTYNYILLFDVDLVFGCQKCTLDIRFVANWPNR